MADVEGPMNGPSLKTKISFLEINVLVVDDDRLTLSLVSSFLRKWNYKVVAVKDPKEAMNVIETQQKSFDLVLSDLHMPELHGLELQKQIHRRFKIPVIFMSADDKENVIMHCLEAGAALYMVKPVCLDDVKNVWQYAVGARKEKSLAIDVIPTFPKRSSAELSSFDNKSCEASKNEKKQEKKDCKRKTSQRFDKNDKNVDQHVTPKKAKVVWTTSLHTRFLQAIGHLGLEKAVPKRILEFMNVPGLTRENVASHLQKYRIFLKRVAESGSISSKKMMERAMKSTFAAGLSPNLLQTFLHGHSQFSENQQMRNSLHPRYRVNTSKASPLNYTKQKSSKRNYVSHLGNRQVLRNQVNFQQPNSLYQGNQEASGLQSYGNGTNMSLHGLNSNGIVNNASRNLMNGTNSMHMYQQPSKASPGIYTTDYNFATSSGFNIGSSSELEKARNSSTFTPKLSAKYPRNTYAGLQMTTGGDMVGINQMQFNGGYSAMNSNMNVAPTSTYFSRAQPSLKVQQYGFGKERVGSNSISGSKNNFHDLNGISLDQINHYQSLDQQCGEEVISNFPDSSHLVEVNVKTSNPNHENKIAGDTNSGVVEQGFSDYSPSYDQNYNQEEDDGGLALELFHMYNEDNNLKEENLFVNQLWDDEFVNSLMKE